MAKRITLDQIREESIKHQWKVTSDSYKNLQTKMSFECPRGHTVYSPYSKIRNKWECPFCSKEDLSRVLVTMEEVEPKHKGKKRILAFDQATHITGYSVFDDDNFITSGVFTSSKHDEDERINEMEHWFRNMCLSWQPDLVGLEDIQLQVVRGKAVGVTIYKVLAHLQGVLINAAYELGFKYTVLSPSTWRSKCNIKGKTRDTKKQAAMYRVKQYYNMDVKDDEADAILIGKCLAENSTTAPVIIENWET